MKYQTFYMLVLSSTLLHSTVCKTWHKRDQSSENIDEYTQQMSQLSPNISPHEITKEFQKRGRKRPKKFGKTLNKAVLDDQASESTENIADDNFIPDDDNNDKDDVTIHKADDVKDDPDKVTDIEQINEKDAEKNGGVIRSKKEKGSHVDQGDIMFHECEEEEMFGTSGNLPNKKCKEKLRKKLKQRDATLIAGKMWSLPIHYVVDSSLGDDAVRALNEAIYEYQNKTCIRFIPVTRSTKDYMWFFKGVGPEAGCWSAVGKDGGRHRISLSEGCETKSTAIHEMMHALGWWHEQSRPDRDSAIKINWDNMDAIQKHNFKKAPGNEVHDYGYGYDFHSVMHYGRTAFGKRACSGGKWKQYNNYWYCIGGNEILLETITPKIKTKLGRCDSCGMSITDALQLNARYCSNHPKQINYHTLRRDISQWMNIFAGVPGDDFRGVPGDDFRGRFEVSGILLRHVYKTHPSYYLTAVSFNTPSRSSTYGYIGYCSQVSKEERNEVVCFTKQKSKFAGKNNEKIIVDIVLGKLKGKGCDIKKMTNLAYKQAGIYGYPVAMVFLSKDGNNVRTAWIGEHSYVRNYKCDKDNFATFIIMFGSG